MLCLWNMPKNIPHSRCGSAKRNRNFTDDARDLRYLPSADEYGQRQLLEGIVAHALSS